MWLRWWGVGVGWGVACGEEEGQMFCTQLLRTRISNACIGTATNKTRLGASIIDATPQGHAHMGLYL